MAALRDSAESALTGLLSDLDLTAVTGTIVRAWRDASSAATLPAIVCQCTGIAPHSPFVAGPLWDAALLVHCVTNAHDDENQADLNALVDLVAAQLDTITIDDVNNGLPAGATCHGVQLEQDFVTAPQENSRQMITIPVLLALHAESIDPTPEKPYVEFLAATSTQNDTDFFSPTLVLRADEALGADADFTLTLIDGADLNWLISPPGTVSARFPAGSVDGQQITEGWDALGVADNGQVQATAEVTADGAVPVGGQTTHIVTITNA